MRTGVIAEYNPFHKGHALQLDAAKAMGGGPVAVVMSGNFVQRGEPALISKTCRARMALAAGADLVAELPLPWAMSTAQNFAEGGVGLLAALGCQAISFGCECGDPSALQRAAQAVDDPRLGACLEPGLAAGLPFAAARQQAVEALYGAQTAALLRRPNDILAVEYLAAANRLGVRLSPIPVRRLGAAHDAALPDAGFSAAPDRETAPPVLSASGIRRLLLEGRSAEALTHIPAGLRPILREELEEQGLCRPGRLERAVLAQLRRMSLEEFAALPDVSEGLENRLYAAVRQAGSLDQLWAAVKVKRYSLARIRRIVLSAFLGLDGRHFRQPVPYIRVLGFSETGLSFIKEAGRRSGLPLLLRAKDMEKLDRRGLDVFQSECRADDLYWLAVDRPRPCGTDLTDPVIRPRGRADENPSACF
ncbi:MAG: nucleotidyltransferase family protein [Clostridiales bacterium]|nr:nucleotidyltransferase family protein [Clostridiales bacterium]